MKKTLIINLSISLIIGLIISCTDDNIVDSSIKEATSQAKEEAKFSFTYLGQTYSSTYQQVNDSVMILNDPQVDSLYKEINKLPDLVTHIEENGNIVFYENYNSYLEEINMMEDNGNLGTNSRGTDAIDSGRLMLHGEGEYLLFNFGTGGLKVPSLGAYQFNDRVTSFSMKANVKCFHITIFRDENYGGRAISFPLSSTGLPDVFNITLTYLKDYKMSSGGGSWYRNASSFQIIYTSPTRR